MAEVSTESIAGEAPPKHGLGRAERGTQEGATPVYIQSGGSPGRGARCSLGRRGGEGLSQQSEQDSSRPGISSMHMVCLCPSVLDTRPEKQAGATRREGCHRISREPTGSRVEV